VGDKNESKQNDARFAKQCAVSTPQPAQTGERAHVIHLSVLPQGARPMPFAPLDYEEVPNSRQLCCPGYNRCLEFVASIKWQGFSCRRCPLKDENNWEDSHNTQERETNGPDAAVIRLSRG